MNTTPTQQELNIRFAKALGWTEILEGNRGQLCGRNHPDNVWGTEIPNYFAPENFHLVRTAVGALNEREWNHFWIIAGFHHMNITRQNVMNEIAKFAFTAPAESIITAYLKVKE